MTFYMYSVCGIYKVNAICYDWHQLKLAIGSSKVFEKKIGAKKQVERKKNRWNAITYAECSTLHCHKCNNNLDSQIECVNSHETITDYKPSMSHLWCTSTSTHRSPGDIFILLHILPGNSSHYRIEQDHVQYFSCSFAFIHSISTYMPHSVMHNVFRSVSTILSPFIYSLLIGEETCFFYSSHTDKASCTLAKLNVSFVFRWLLSMDLCIYFVDAVWNKCSAQNECELFPVWV